MGGIAHTGAAVLLGPRNAVPSALCSAPCLWQSCDRLDVSLNVPAVQPGRILGDLTSRVLLSVIYLAVLPLFVVAARLLDPPKPGWKRRAAMAATLEAARRQF